MPLYRYEIDDRGEVYGFSIIAPDDSTAKRLARLMGKAVYIGEAVEPETLAHQVAKARLN